tara:strand:+ start:2222 stop:2461 length:240 start_codon:yes stop_codon:yes gene_type:complete
MPFVKDIYMALKDRAKGFKGSELVPGVKRKRPHKKKNYFHFGQLPQKTNKQTDEERKAKVEELRKKRAKELKEFEKWWK